MSLRREHGSSPRWKGRCRRPGRTWPTRKLSLLKPVSSCRHRAPRSLRSCRDSEEEFHGATQVHPGRRAFSARALSGHLTTSLRHLVFPRRSLTQVVSITLPVTSGSADPRSTNPRCCTADALCSGCRPAYVFGPVAAPATTPPRPAPITAPIGPPTTAPTTAPATAPETAPVSSAFAVPGAVNAENKTAVAIKGLRMAHLSLNHP